MALFRSKARDLQTDSERLAAIRKVVEAQIAEAEAELAGLKRRLEADVEAAAFLYGPELASQTLNDPISNAQLLKTEQSIGRGEQRVRELERHLEQLRDIAVKLQPFSAEAG